MANRELRTPGEMLQQARLERGATLLDMERLTKIPERLLAAVEMDRYADLSGPLYVRSFLRTYAGSLGLDPGEVVRAYERHAAGGNAEHAEEVWQTEAQVRRVGFSWRRPVPWLILLALVALVVLARQLSCAG